ncbi:SET and MYND domain-containing protein 4 [Amphibalanus amphitrite]|uniref:SET and MYND domain-containing protein 4 n=1 Tax=Amphibalanus amphitrite TaxID=1232801 RepID=A0A6A4W1P3_AMPAM|nr:SET and MYND domain-containing protein 4-like [Amphibalanus amphitrite]KAF0300345.1 SET and MYND domain-containing protein 4 [Amphibalanus amphitrite]
MDGPTCAGPQPFGEDAFSTFYDGVCAEVRALGIEQFRAEFDALDTDSERVSAVLRLESAGRLRLPTASRTGKSEQQARSYLEMAMNCTDSSRKLVLCNTALQHCPAPAAGAAPSELHLAVLLNRLWTVYELGRFSSGLAEAQRLLDEPALAAAPVETRVQLLVERARFEAALAHRPAAEASVRQALQIVRQLERQQQAMYARELGTIRKRLTDAEPAQADSSAPGPPPAPRLFAGEHERLRRVSSAVELVTSERRGRHLVATTDIPPGSVVIADEPFAWSLHPPRWTTHCQHCCRPADCPLPCPNCASVLFCSQPCRSEALRLYHATECPVLDLLIDPNLGRMALLVFRVLARAGPEALERAEELDSESASDVYDSLAYEAVHSQVTNTADRPMGDVIKRCAVALYLTACLQRAGVGSAERRVAAAALALRHLQSCSCNAYEITELRLGGGGARLAEFEELGGAVYAAVSLTNHSCFPNVVRSSRGRGVTVTTTRPLRAGDELLDNYGFHFHEEEETARYAALRRQYQFHCECAACEQGWPLYAELADGAPPGAEQRAAVELLVLGRYAEAAARLAPVVAADGAGEPSAPPDKQAVQRQSLFIRCIQSTGNISAE